MDQPQVWQDWARMSEYAENEAQRQQQASDARKARTRKGL